MKCARTSRLSIKMSTLHLSCVLGMVVPSYVEVNCISVLVTVTAGLPNTRTVTGLDCEVL